MITRKNDASLLGLNTLGIDCRCRELITYTDANDLDELYQEGVFNGKWLHLGAGANTLFDCEYYDGTILHSRCKGYISNKQKAGGNVVVEAQSGWIWDELVVKMLEDECFGAENLSGIPASAGGAVVQNIGAYGMEIRRIVTEVELFDTVSGKHFVMSNKECGFAYRASAFKRIGCPLIVASVKFMLSDKSAWQPCLEYAALQSLVNNDPTPWDMRKAVLAQRNSKLPDPDKVGNAGSFFVNPIIGEEQAKELQARYSSMPQYPVGDGVKLAAGWLVDQAGLKGYRMGNAAVDSKNALVLVNLGHATGQEILALAHHVSQVVQAKFGVCLKPEVNIVR